MAPFQGASDSHICMNPLVLPHAPPSIAPHRVTASRTRSFRPVGRPKKRTGDYSIISNELAKMLVSV